MGAKTLLSRGLTSDIGLIVRVYTPDYLLTVRGIHPWIVRWPKCGEAPVRGSPRVLRKTSKFGDLDNTTRVSQSRYSLIYLETEPQTVGRPQIIGPTFLGSPSGSICTLFGLGILDSIVLVVHLGYISNCPGYTPQKLNYSSKFNYPDSGI